MEPWVQFAVVVLIVLVILWYFGYISVSTAEHFNARPKAVRRERFNQAGYKSTYYDSMMDKLKDTVKDGRGETNEDYALADMVQAG
jgi:uncharacterized membrane protein